LNQMMGIERLSAQSTSSSREDRTRVGMGPPRRSVFRRIVSEPLVQFLCIGAILFGVYRLVGPAQDTGESVRTITVTSDDLRQLTVAWLAQGRPAPTPQQLRGLVDQKVALEILSREAVALGLDKGDEVIRRRLAQKMEFLFEDVAAMKEPTTAELRSWYAENTHRFLLPARISFQHLYFAADRHGMAPEEAAKKKLASLVDPPANGAPSQGAEPDTFMMQDAYEDRTEEQLTRDFGPNFAKAIFGLQPGSWGGPIQSGYGWHVVHVDSVVASSAPDFEEVEARVKEALLEQQNKALKQKAFAQMRARYEVVSPPIDENVIKSLAPGSSGSP
jgi:peptidyl-prolyl cis-trans isomerase C